MAQYVGLTDDPEKRKELHGNPEDWELMDPFENEREARNWEMLKRISGFKGGERTGEWKYGFIYTITIKTNESI
ncbi:MAG: hypothetical protein P9L92_20280 [Candidatus Electryonea clarkiae]|nr:hypothetical protein [Candidatus Electryonea clarkiae]MDP8286613.1 hypothetical protein [Candidatus Electryonea clarkiae]